MSSKKRNSLIMLIIVIVLGLAIIGSLIALILQRTGFKSITIAPGFADTELDVNQDYIINIASDPAGADATKFKYQIDSSAATFTVFDDSSAILHTNSEGSVTVYVTKGKIESNYLTFNIVDKAAEEAARQAAEAAAEAERLAAEQAAAEAEAAAAAEAEANKQYVKVIKTDINVRSAATTDSEAVGKATKGDQFEVINNDGSWTEINYNGQTGFIRNDLIEVVSDGESSESSETAAETTTETAEAPQQETKKEEAKKEEKPAEQQQATNNDNAQAAADAAADAAAKAAAEQQKLLEEQQKQLEAAAAQAAAAAAAAPAVASGPLPAAGAWSYGGEIFSAAEVAHFHALWDYTGDAAEMVTHHSAGELKTVSRVDGIIQ